MGPTTEPTQDDSSGSVILVDDNGRETGSADKVECHRGPGRLHRALTCLLFDGRGRLLFARRSPSKATWPGYWDAAVATHQRRGEGDEEAARRRVADELGVNLSEVTGTVAIRYHAVYSSRWCEREHCAVLLGRVHDSQVSQLAPAPEEIDGLSWVETGRLRSFIASRPVAPWFHLAWEALQTEARDTLLDYLGGRAETRRRT